MKRVELELEMLTPTFLAGHDNSKDAKPEWRAPSVRGQLRWWLRALAAPDVEDPEERIKKVRELETAVFGSTKRRSPVTVRTDRTYGGRVRDDYARLKYLAYGCFDLQSGDLVREPFHPGTKASVTLQWRSRELGKESEALLWKSVWGWLALGGIGFKARNGFGSLTLIGKSPKALSDLSFNSTDDFRRALQARLGTGGRAPDLPEWSHWSPKVRVLVSKQSTRSGVDALQKAASWLSNLRSGYGARKDTRTLDGMPLRQRDVTWVKHKKKSTYHTQAPDRAGFGLPLPFHSPDDTIAEDEIVTWNSGKGVGRRASPLHLHVGRFGKRYRTVWTYLPARLIPEGHKLTFVNDRKTFAVSAAQREIVDRTLNQFVKDGHLEEVWS